MYEFKIILDSDEIITVTAEDILKAVLECDVSESHIIAIIRQ